MGSGLNATRHPWTFLHYALVLCKILTSCSGGYPTIERALCTTEMTHYGATGDDDGFKTFVEGIESSNFEDAQTLGFLVVGKRSQCLDWTCFAVDGTGFERYDIPQRLHELRECSILEQNLFRACIKELPTVSSVVGAVLPGGLRFWGNFKMTCTTS